MKLISLESERDYPQACDGAFNPFIPKIKPFKEKYISEVVRIGSIIIFHLSELWKAKFFLLCGVIFLVRLQEKFEIDHSWELKG